MRQAAGGTEAALRRLAAHRLGWLTRARPQPLPA